jgi:hypothetical protein
MFLSGLASFTCPLHMRLTKAVDFVQWLLIINACVYGVAGDHLMCNCGPFD